MLTTLFTPDQLAVLSTLGQDDVSQVEVAQGPMIQRPIVQGPVAQGAPSQGAASQGQTSHDEVADRALARRVALFLATRKVGDLRRLTVAARQGRVRLSGELESFYHRQLAVFYARKVAGVVTVDDHITVASRRRPIS